MPPNIVIIAGPNGSGKSTSAPTLVNDLLGIKTFVNADTIAAGLSAFDVESVAIEAGRLMLRRLDELVEQKMDFAFETTLASRTFVKSIVRWKQRGYRVYLFFLYLPSPEFAVARVQARVVDGGHNIPEKVVERRYYRGIYNFLNLYLPIVDEWQAYDSSSEELKRIATGSKDQFNIYDQARWMNLKGVEK